MEDIEKLVKATLGEIEKVLTTKTVVGESVTVEGATIVPLISIGFGFGAGGGSGQSRGKESGRGFGGGTIGGAGVKPVAMVIVDKDGVRVESVMGGMASAIEKTGEAIPRMIERIFEKRRTRKKEG